jgi:FdhD protein
LIDGKAGIGRMSDFPGRVSIMVDDATDIPTYDPMLAARLGPTPCALRNGGLDRAPLADLDVDPAERAGWKMERGRFVDVTESLFSRLHSDQAAHGTHCAVAADGAAVCIAARDLNQHNAVHKVIGWTVLQEHDRSRAMLCVTGQVDASMVTNVWRAGFPLIASTCGPTSDAIDIADAAGITIVGRVLKAERAVYSHGWRLTIGDEGESTPNAGADN